MTQKIKLYFWASLVTIYVVGVVVVVEALIRSPLSATSIFALGSVLFLAWTFGAVRMSLSLYRLIEEEDQHLKVVEVSLEEEPSYVVDKARVIYNNSITKTLLRREWSDLTAEERRFWVERARTS